MTVLQTNQAMAVLMAGQDLNVLNDTDLLDLFESFLKESKGEKEEIPNLPRGFGQ